MKRRIITMACGLLSMASLSAQEVTAEEVEASSFKRNIITAKVGGAVSNVLSRGLSTTDVFGYHVGISDQVNLAKSLPLYFETGLFATMKGYEISGYDESETKMHYLQLPLLLNYHIGKQGGFEVVPAAGLYVAYGLVGKLKYNVDLDTYREINVFKDKTISRWDFGAQFGVDLVFNKVQVGVAYDLGLMDIDKEDPIYGKNEDKLGYRELQTRSLIFRVGVNF